MEIDGIEVCKPIELLVNLLLRNNFIIVNKTVNDYHFREVSIIMKGKFFKELDNIHIDNISRVKVDVFTCECNWSTVKLEYE